MKKLKSEDELSRVLVKQLDGVPINKARMALQNAILLLSSTQVVSAKSPLLLNSERVPLGRRKVP
jgi:hypothetical protein